MKSKEKLKKMIRGILIQEFNLGAAGASGWDSNNDITLFHGYPSLVQKFPYEDTDLPENLKKINRLKDYMDSYYSDTTDSYNKLAQNKDVYKFPFKEFKIGLDVESHDASKYNKQINIIDVAKIVLEKLIDDPQYYSKLAGD